VAPIERIEFALEPPPIRAFRCLAGTLQFETIVERGRQVEED
jgi:hypothetical protein